jgi:hypothetical protein
VLRNMRTVKTGYSDAGSRSSMLMAQRRRVFWC